MNKNIILFTAVIISVIVSNNIAFSSESIKDKNIRNIASKKLNGSIVDYKTEYINSDWWDKFNDPILREYILKAVEANHDIKIATLKVYESQSMVQESLGRELPFVSFQPDFVSRKTSANTKFATMSIPAVFQNSYLVPFNVNYEFDLWKKNRDKTLSVEKQLEAVKFDEKAAYISLTSAVASAYFNVIKTDKLIEFQREIISLRKNIAALIYEKNKYGLCSSSEVIAADKALIESQSSLNDFEKYQNFFLNQLSVLIGDSVDNSLLLKRSSLDSIVPIESLPRVINSDIVLKRPDVLRAEAELQKAKIDINLARKEYLPDILITGQLGFNSNSLAKVLNWDSYISSVGVGAFQSIFTGGQRKARLKIKKFHYDQLFENYQKVILQSFQEVNNSLTSLKIDGQKDNDNIKRILLEKTNLDLINEKYNEGVISYLELLEYKEKYVVLKKEQVQSKVDCLVDSLSLYKSAGGKL
jgi:NodT family efflux transporter outer membrane factor (OMF) lipoprotein